MTPTAALSLAAFLVFSSAPAAARIASPVPSGPIAFSSFRDGQVDIYTMGWDGRGVRNVTRDPAPDFQPAWSPDGSVIAFVSLHTELSHFDQIFTIDPATGERRQLTDVDGGNPQAPAWSPDGSRIAFHVVYGGALDAELFVMNADGTHLLQLTENAFEDSSLVWSPDGSRIAFVHDGRIETMDTDGGHVEPVTPGAMLAFDPAWSPDGDRLAFAGRRSGASQEDLFTIAVDGSAIRRISHTSKSESEPSWSPGGRWLAYALTQLRPENDEESNWILKVRPNGTGRARLSATGSTRDSSPDWRVQFQTASSRSYSPMRSRSDPRARLMMSRLLVVACSAMRWACVETVRAVRLEPNPSCRRCGPLTTLGSSSRILAASL
jgi:Tol biopolymer transport system component